MARTELLAAFAAPFRGAPDCDIVTPVSAQESLKVLETATPAVVRGAVPGPDASWLPFGVLKSNRTVAIAVNPTSVAPLKLQGRSLVRAATVEMSMVDALRMLHDQSRRHYAYMSSLPLTEVPELKEAMPLQRVAYMAGNGTQEANLWINPNISGMFSSAHYDGHDNLLVQLRGSKLVLLLPPEAHEEIGYTFRDERAYSFDIETATFHGHTSRGLAPTENQAALHVFSHGADNHLLEESLETLDGMETRLKALAPRARLCYLQPGETLYIPALWTHAVASSSYSARSPETAEDDTHGLNVAVNFWFYRGTQSFERQLFKAPQAGWPYAQYCRAEAMVHNNRPEEAAHAYAAAASLYGSPSGRWFDQTLYHDAVLNLGLMLSRLGLPLEAEHHYKQAQHARPSHWASYSHLGRALNARGELSESAENFQMALSLHPQDAPSYLGLGVVRASQRRQGEAAYAFERAVGVSPSDATGYDNLGVYFESIHRLPEAAAAFDAAVTLRPSWEKVARSRRRVRKLAKVRLKSWNVTP